MKPFERFWSALDRPARTEVMQAYATAREYRRVRSKRAPNAWWGSLSDSRREAILEAETPFEDARLDLRPEVTA